MLTDPGSELGLGEKATVAWQSAPGRGRRPGRQGTASWCTATSRPSRTGSSTRQSAASALYYVTVTVANVGDTDLGGGRIPLYVLDGAGALVESSSFKTDFEPVPEPGHAARAS